mgnify:CR=1 FL=1
MHRHLCLTVVGLMIAGCHTGERRDATDSPPPGQIDSRADEVLKRMGEFLRSHTSLYLVSEAVFEVVEPDGQKIEYGRRTQVSMKRPNRIRADATGDQSDRGFWYNRNTVAILDRLSNTYSTIETPDTADAMFDHLAARYGMAYPAADLLYADPHAVLLEHVQQGAYIGLHRVDGRPCHHLAFRQRACDWQIWVEDGPTPWPRKMVITYKTQSSMPRFAARFVEWDASRDMNEDLFTFAPPADATKIEMTPVDAGGR